MERKSMLLTQIVSSGQGQSSESLDEEEIDKRSQASGLAKKHRRRKKAGTTLRKSMLLTQIVSSGQGRSSESLDEEEIDKRSQASGLAKKHKRKKKAGTFWFTLRNISAQSE
ncbi:hypothetical protein GDO86_000357 [Hymenochirus boettgeri]|uniref:Uncharacterized protein n=1 Tax=Hymenochirus boettgeri TaxID=247094 RepID=A0A8T2KGE7_9PIPI|nr:hypothetical protein GDO86_000357 [Hymenochirus boettgeri]